MKTKQIFSCIGIVAITVILCGGVGFFLGMTIGGNMVGHVGFPCTDVDGTMVCDEPDQWTYRGLPGYEGGGLLGFHIGMLTGLGIGMYIWKTRCEAMMLRRVLVSVLIVAAGIFLIVYGEYDDSPGGQLLGLLLTIFGLVRLWRRAKKA